MNSLFYLGVKGGEVHFLRDGEIMRSLPLGGGVYSTASFEKLRRPGETVGYPVPLLRLTGHFTHVRHPGAFDSAANPSFRVSPGQRQARDLSRMMARSEALNRSAHKALQAAKRASRDVPKLEHKPDLPVSTDDGSVSAT